MGAFAVTYLRAFVDARTPLLVADGQGVRIRLGRTWRGLPWGALREVANLPRRGLMRDGRLTLVPHNPDRVFAELDASGRRQVGVNRRLYGAPLAVPLGLSTRVTGADGDLTTALRTLAGDRALVVEVSRAAPVATEEPVEASVVELVETTNERAASVATDEAVGAVQPVEPEGEPVDVTAAPAETPADERGDQRAPGPPEHPGPEARSRGPDQLGGVTSRAIWIQRRRPG